MKILPPEFEGQPIPRVYDESTETWWFSVIDVVKVLTDSSNANRYWSDLKRKLAQEAGSEQPCEKIVRLKLTAPDGKRRETDCRPVVTGGNYLPPAAPAAAPAKALRAPRKRRAWPGPARPGQARPGRPLRLPPTARRSRPA